MGARADELLDSILDGVLRGLATSRRVPTPDLIERILNRLSPLGDQDGLRFWAAVAAADWPGPRAASALEEWTRLPRADVAEAAESSKRQEYVRHPFL